MAVIETQGTVISIGDAASPEVFTAIPQVVSISGPDGQTPEVDVTNLSSTAREFILGLNDNGNVSVPLQYDAGAVHEGLYAKWAARTAHNFRITLTDSPATTLTFAARVQAFPFDVQADNVITVAMNLRITGAVTLA
jgi:hypothetical protein